MAKENNGPLSPLILFVIACVLLTGGWLMKSFPVFLFAGFAPLIAITDHVKKEDLFWDSFEWILIALTLSFFAAHFFDFSFFVNALIQAIVFTVGFVCFSYARQNLGDRLGKLPIIFFWLALEYVFLKIHWPSDSLFLADAFALKTSWLQWTIHTGYLGASFWILLCNLILYYSVFKNRKINWLALTIFFVCLTGPIILSFVKGGALITREDMFALYYQENPQVPLVYMARGEFIPRTAAWISVLILLFAVVKNKTKKK
jgi:apolipoprotein N-acyltransferase